MSEEENIYIAIDNNAGPPKDCIDARIEAFSLANWECTVKKDNCLTQPVLVHQKKLIIKNGITGYERVVDGVMQTADNIVPCCPMCLSWISNNPEEATTLGYINR